MARLLLLLLLAGVGHAVVVVVLWPAVLGVWVGWLVMGWTAAEQAHVQPLRPLRPLRRLRLLHDASLRGGVPIDLATNACCGLGTDDGQ